MRPVILTEELSEEMAAYLRGAFPAADITEFWVDRLQALEYRLVEEDHTRYHLQVAADCFEHHGARIVERLRHWDVAGRLRSHPDDCLRLESEGPVPCK